MYPHGWRDLLDGWTKNIARGAGAAPAWAVAGTVAWVAGLGAIAVDALVGLVAWVGGGRGAVARAVAYLAAAAHTGWAFRRVGRFGAWAALAFPVPLAVFLAVFVRSVVAVVTRRPVRWRDRHVVHDDRRRSRRRAARR